MNRLAQILLVAAAGAAGLFVGTLPQAAQVSDPRTEFSLPTLDGERLGPRDFPGEVVVIDFWATWCAPCRIQAEVLHQLHEELAPQGVRFLAVNLGEDEETVRSFVADQPFPYPVLLDPDESLTVRLSIMGLPTLLVIDTAGRVTYLRPGLLGQPQIRELIEEAAA